MYRRWIEEGLKKRKLSQRDLARRLDMSDSVVSRILAGTRELKANEVDAIARLFGEPPPSTVSPALGSVDVGRVPVTAIAIEGVWQEAAGISSSNPKAIIRLTNPGYNNRSAQGIEDAERTIRALSGAKGKRLTYTVTGRPQTD